MDHFFQSRTTRGILWSCFILVLLTAAAAPPAVTTQEPIYNQDFETNSLTEWDLSPAWQVAQVDGSQALRGSGHDWAWLNVSMPVDLLVQFRLKLEPGAALHANLRVSGAIRYFIGLRGDGTYIAKQTGDQDFQHDLARSAGLGSGWHVIQMAAAGNTVRVAVDGGQVMSWQDPSPLDGTQVAFESLESGAVWIDDLLVVAYGAGQPFPLDLAAPAVVATSAPAAVATTSPQGETAALLDNPSWVYTGGPLGGLGYDVRMRPDNPDILFVTDAKAGVFKSTDGGKNWFASNNGITTRTGETNELIPIFSLTIDPNNPDIVWTGTQFQGGVYKSNDGGDTWKKMVNGIQERDLTVRGFAVDPRDSNSVYFAAEVSSWEWSGQGRQGREFDLVKGVVYKTTNGGANWSKVWGGDNLARYILIDPRNSNTLYVSTGIFDREAANSDPQAGTPGGVGVLKSTDGGQSWTAMTTGMSNLYVGSLFMHPQNPDILLAGTGNVQYPEGSGVYLTSDGGQSWRRTLDASVVESVEFASTDPQIAYAGNFGRFYRSEDGGMTWDEVSGEEYGAWGAPGIQAGHPIDFQVDPRDPDRIFSNQYGGGNFLTEDGGETWQAASRGYTGAMVRALAADPVQPGRIVAAGRSGIFVSYNGGADWEGIANPPFYSIDWHEVAMSPSDPQYLLAELTCWKSLVRSRDGGTKWSQALQTSRDRTAFTSIAFAPSQTDTVYAATSGFYSCGSFDPSVPGDGIYVSQDGGINWSRLSDPLLEGLSFNKVVVDPQDPHNVFAATMRKGLLRSVDGGQAWSQVGGGLPADQSINAVAFDPQDSRILLASRGRGGLMRSTDGGSNWAYSSAGMPNEASVSSIVFDPNRPGVVYAADLFSGVYRSKDGGATWKAINTGLLVRAMNDLALSSDGLHLYAASEGNGVYRLDLAGQPPAAAFQPTAVPQASPTRLPTSGAGGASPTEEAQAAGDDEGFLSCFGLFLPVPLVVLLLGWRRILHSTPGG